MSGSNAIFLTSTRGCPMMKLRTVMVAAVLMMVVMAMAETPSHQSETLSIEGYTGQANVIQYQGRALVDVLDLARITNGSLRFEKGGITLTLLVRRRRRAMELINQVFPPLHEGSDRGDGVYQTIGRNAAGDCPEWVSRSKHHGWKHDRRTPESSC